MGSGTQREHFGSGDTIKSPDPSAGTRQLVRGEGLVARTSNAYRPQPPMIRNDSSEPGVSCHVVTSWLEDPEETRKRSWEHKDSFHYPDSEESEDDIVDTDECENELPLINLRNEVPHPIMVDTCGERCAQLDDFSWVRPTEEWNEESDMPESEIDTPHIGMVFI